MSSREKTNTMIHEHCLREIGCQIVVVKKLQSQLALQNEIIEKLEACRAKYASYEMWFNSGNKKINRVVSDVSIESFDLRGFSYHKAEVGGKLARQTEIEINKIRGEGK